MKFIKLSALALSAVLALGFASCSDDNNDTPSVNQDQKATELTAVSKQYVDNVVNQTYKQLADSTELLFEQLHAIKLKLQNDPNSLTDAEVSNACETFRRARANYEKSEAFLFGAATDYGIDPHIDTWPLGLQNLAVALTNTAQVEAMDDYEEGHEGDINYYNGNSYAGGKLGPELLGFHGIEFILFRDGKERTAADLRANDTYQGTSLAGKFEVTGENELIFATAVAGDLRDRCWQMEVTWNEDAPADHFKHVGEDLELPTTAASSENSYGWILTHAGEAGSTYASSRKAMEAILVAGCANIANEVGQTKMGKPHSGEDENYIESPYSQRSFIDFWDNIQSIENSYYGSLKGSADATIKASLHGYLAQYNPTLDAQLSKAIADAKAAIKACPAPFVKNFKDPAVQTAMNKCGELTTVLNEASKWILAN